MREYRAKRRALERPKESVMRERYRTADAMRITDLLAENRRLTEEVHRLKRALAQANRDAILRKVNRTGRE